MFYIVVFKGDCEASVCQNKKEVQDVILEVYDNNTDVDFEVYMVGPENMITVGIVPQRISWGEKE